MIKLPATPELANDPFFNRGADTVWNACIGPQANEENYIDGFIEAALLLTNEIIDKNLLSQRDTLVMPILYTARHGLELALKFTINHLGAMGVLTNSHPANHDILSHWKLLDGSLLGDEKLNLLIKHLYPFVCSLSQIDEDGQELRYHRNRDGDVSLADKPLANLVVIRDSLIKMTEAVNDLKNRVWDMDDERHTGSHTRDCSRRDLMEIARMMPAKSEWVNPAFDEAKQAVMTRFSVGSGKFSDAIDVILANREMKTIIGLDSELIHLSGASAVLLVEEWIKRRDATYQHRPLGLDYFDPSRFDNMVKDSDINRMMLDTVRAELTDDEIADAEAIYYLGRDKQPPEFYEKKVECNRRAYAAGGDVRQHLNHIMTKTNFLDAFQLGIRRLGNSALAERITTLAQDNPDPRGE